MPGLPGLLRPVAGGGHLPTPQAPRLLGQARATPGLSLDALGCAPRRAKLDEDSPVTFYCQHPPTLRLQPGRSRLAAGSIQLTSKREHPVIFTTGRSCRRLSHNLVRARRSRMLHADEKFGHQPGEVNFWMPLTDYALTRTAALSILCFMQICSSRQDHAVDRISTGAGRLPSPGN